MGKSITTRIAAGAAAAGIAAAMVAVGGGTASAAPITGSADAVADFVTGLGLFPVPKHEGLKAPGQTVTVNEDGTVEVALSNPNAPDDTVLCGAEIVPALEVGDGNPLGVEGALADSDIPLGPILKNDPRTFTSKQLAPGIYAVISGCGVWEDADDMGEKAPIGITANQPHFFVTLGGLL